MLSIIEQLKDTPIPGVVNSLLSVPQAGEEWDELSITGWSSGTSWNMRVNVGEIRQQDVWDGVRQSLEDLVRGVLPNGVLPDGNIVDSEAYREWVNNFVTSTNHIEWIDHEVDGYSWLRSFIIKLREWEESQPNPVLRSQNVFLLIERIMTLRDMVVDEFYFEQNYQRLKIENALNHFYIIFFWFFIDVCVFNCCAFVSVVL